MPGNRWLPGLAVVLLIGACGDSEPREGALTADEERQLNEAAAMLDEPPEPASEALDESASEAPAGE